MRTIRQRFAREMSRETSPYLRALAHSILRSPRFTTTNPALEIPARKGGSSVVIEQADTELRANPWRLERRGTD